MDFCWVIKKHFFIWEMSLSSHAHYIYLMERERKKEGKLSFQSKKTKKSLYHRKGIESGW